MRKKRRPKRWRQLRAALAVHGVAPHEPLAVEHEVRQQERHLLTAQRSDQLDAIQLHRQAPTQLDSRPLTYGNELRQRYGNVSPTRYWEGLDSRSPGAANHQ